MFLTIPTVEELKGTDLPDLMEMLVKHTDEYHKEIKTEGSNPTTLAIRELINNIQSAIEAKKDIHQTAAQL